MQLEKAMLQAIKADGSPDGDPIPVQFNPSSLRLQITNETEGGESRGRQVRQYTGSSSTTLSVELIFDTADEGTTDSPRSVREKTAQVEQFVYPRGEGDEKQAPPKLRFEWGDLILEGVVESITIDLDHFAPNGYPLRAKVGFSFKEQDRRFELLAAGSGANRAGAAPKPGESSPGSLGTVGAGAGARVGLALGGESAAEFAARMGLDPAGWRGLSIGVSAGGSLSLDAGLEIGFSAGLSASAGLGVTVGANAGAAVSVEAAFGLSAEAGVRSAAGVSARAEVQRGFTVSAAGGLGAALESVKIAKSEIAAKQSREAFASPPTTASASLTAPVGTKPSMPEQSRTPLGLTGLPSPAAQEAAGPAPPPPAADTRAASFGFGVPLRPAIGGAALGRSSSMGGQVPLEAKAGGGRVPTTNDPTTPPWVALPAGVSAASAAPKASRTKTPCGCSSRRSNGGPHR